MRRTIVFLFLTFLAATATSVVADPAGVAPLVANPAEPRDGVVDMKLTELWRRGGEDDEVFFGVVLKALSDDAGNVYLLDQQLSEIQVFGPDGEHLRTLSREGEGPGETRRPSDMLWMPDGTLGIVQTFPGRIVQIDVEGNSVGNYTIGGEGAIVAVAEAQSGGGNMVLGVIDIEAGQGQQDRHVFLGSFDENGDELCRYTGFDVHWDFPNVVFREREQYFVMFGKWDLMADGRVIAVPDPYDYAFDVFAADGTVQRRISRAFEPYERDDEDRALIESIMAGAARQFPFPIETEIEDHETPIAQVLAHPSGEIWILPARGIRNQPEGVLATWDVFDGAGSFARQVQVNCPGDGRRDGMYFVGDDRLLVVHGLVDALSSQFGGGGDEQEAEEIRPIEVVCYRIEDRP